MDLSFYRSKKCEHCGGYANNTFCGKCSNAMVGEISEIIPGHLYLTSDGASRQYDRLRKRGIRQIITIGSELASHNTNEFETMHIRIDDSPNEHIFKHFGCTNKFIDSAPTLVHCRMGISRSVSIVIAFLIYKYKMKYDQALGHVRKTRPIAGPNVGFITQLLRYEASIIPQERVSLVSSFTLSFMENLRASIAEAISPSF